MDWVAGDFTQIYADTFVMPLGGQGVYVQEGAEPPCYGERPPLKEGFGNFPLVNRGGRHSRIMHGIGQVSQEDLPYTGPLLPAERLRPRGGGPAPSEAFPLMTQSEGLDRPYALSVPAPSQSRDGFASRGFLWKPLSDREVAVGIAAALIVLSVVLAALAIGRVLSRAPLVRIVIGDPPGLGGAATPQPD